MLVIMLDDNQAFVWLQFSQSPIPNPTSPPPFDTFSTHWEISTNVKRFVVIVVCGTTTLVNGSVDSFNLVAAYFSMHSSGRGRPLFVLCIAHNKGWHFEKDKCIAHFDGWPKIQSSFQKINSFRFIIRHCIHLLSPLARDSQVFRVFISFNIHTLFDVIVCRLQAMQIVRIQINFSRPYQDSIEWQQWRHLSSECFVNIYKPIELKSFNCFDKLALFAEITTDFTKQTVSSTIVWYSKSNFEYPSTTISIFIN